MVPQETNACKSFLGEYRISMNRHWWNTYTIFDVFLMEAV